MRYAFVKALKMPSFFPAMDLVDIFFLGVLYAWWARCRGMGATSDPTQFRVEPDPESDGIWVPVPVLTEEGRSRLGVELGDPPVRFAFFYNNQVVQVEQSGEPLPQSADGIYVHPAELVGFTQLQRWGWNDVLLPFLLAPFARIHLTIQNGQINILEEVPEDTNRAVVEVRNLPRWVQDWVRSVLEDGHITMLTAFGRTSFLVTPPSFGDFARG